MKKIAFAFMIATGLTIPGLSQAQGTVAEINISFDRDLNREAVASGTVRQEVDPVQYLVNSGLRGGSDQLAASFDRDLNRKWVITYVVRQEVDPVQYLVNSGLRGGSDQLAASFDRAFASLQSTMTGVNTPDLIHAPWWAPQLQTALV